MGIKVRAINPGLYGLYREPGHEFEIKEEKHFSSKWMEKVEAKTSAKGKAKGKDKPEESDESESEASSEGDVI